MTEALRLGIEYFLFLCSHGRVGRELVNVFLKIFKMTETPLLLAETIAHRLTKADPDCTLIPVLAQLSAPHLYLT